MTHFSEVAIVLTELSYRKLLKAINTITDARLRHNVDDLILRGGIYRNRKENTIFIYWHCVYWQNTDELAMDEVVFIENFLKNLYHKEYRYLRVEGHSKVHFSGSLPSDFDPMPNTIIDKRVLDCEGVGYHKLEETILAISQSA